MVSVEIRRDSNIFETKDRIRAVCKTCNREWWITEKTTRCPICLSDLVIENGRSSMEKA